MMNHRNSAFALLTVFFLGSAPSTNAQDKHALIQQLMEVTNMSGQITTGAQTAATPIMDQIKKSNPTMPDETYNYIRGKVQGELSSILSSFMNQWGYKIWEQDFNEKELQYVIDFYRSETGKRFVEMMPVMTQQLMTHLPEYLQEALPKIKDVVKQAAAEKKYDIKF